MKIFISGKRKFVLAVLAIGLLGLAACGGGNDTVETVVDNNQPPAPPIVVETPEPATATDVEEYALIVRELDLEGRVITSASWWDVMRGRGTGSEPPDPATVANYLVERMQWDNLRRIEEEFNVSFDYIILPQGEVSPTLLASVMAGDSLADIWYLLGGQNFSAINGDLLHSASAFAPPTADMLNAQRVMRPRNNLFGEIWNFSDTSPMVHGMGMGVNLDIINAIGAPNPVDLFNAGEWTWDAMREIMIMATKDTTGDGSIDQFGISGQPHNIMINLIAANDGHLVNPDTLTYAFGDPNTLEALEFIFDIFNTYNVWYYDSTSGNPMGDWGRNTFSYRDGRSALFTTATWMLQYDNLPFEYAFVPYPLGPSSRNGFVRMYGFSSGYAIPVTTQNPQDVLRIMEEVFSWAIDEPELITMAALDYARPAWLTDDDVWRVIHVGDHVSTDIGMVIYGYYWVLGTFAHYFWNGYMTVSQAVEAFRPQQQEMIDMVFGDR